MSPGSVHRGNTADRKALFGVIFAAVLLRILLPAFDGADFYAGLWETSGQTNPYSRALREYPLSYLLYDHVLPPLFTIKNILLHLLWDEAWARFWNFILVSVAGITASVLVFLTLRTLSVARSLSVVASVVVSARLPLWETWGGSWDALNPALIAFLVWCLARFLQNPNNRSGWHLSIAGASLVAGFNFGSVAVAACLITSIVISLPRTRFAGPALRVVSLPVLVIAVLVVKNGTQHDIWSVSSGAGQNIIQNLNMAVVDPDGRGARNLAAANGYPAWWIWCYDDAERRKIHPVPNVAGFYGLCIFDRNWKHDYTGLRDWLSVHNDPALSEVVARDLRILRDRPWLWVGPVHERSTGFSAQYGKVSQRLFLDVLIAYPRNFAGRMFDNLTRHYLWEGATFLVAGTRSPVQEPAAWRVFNWIGVASVLFGYVSSLGIVFAVGLRRLGAWLRKGRFTAPTPVQSSVFAISALGISVALVSAAMACCENYRHAFCLFPAIIVLSFWSLDWLWQQTGRIFGPGVRGSATGKPPTERSE